MPRFFIVANPTSGRGTGARVIPIVEQLMQAHGLDYALALTQRPWHAVELVHQGVHDGFDTIVAVGGDGTVNEVLNGLMLAGQNGKGMPSLGVISVGRGNDFAYSMGVPHHLQAAVQTLADGNTRPIDLARLTYDACPEGRVFGNGVGIGFDAIVGYESNKLAPLSGFVCYLVAALKTIMLYFRAPRMEIKLDEETIVQPSLMVSVMNGIRMGGGFYMTPESIPDDGSLDLCIAGSVNRFEILKVILRFMRGSQAGHPAIQFRRSHRVEVTGLDQTLPVHADGEILTLDTHRLTLEVMPAAVQLIVPPEGSS